MSRREADVIIVGAGLSGLIAARTVLQAGLTPLVLEADERVGGRILTEDALPGVPVELGAQWIGDTHERMFALAAELGVETFPQYDEGETSYDLVGSGVLRENDFHARFGSELAELEKVLRLLDELAAEVPPEAPWLAPRAAAWDSITAGAWYDGQGLSPVARTLLEICTVGILAVPTVEVSLLHLLFTIQTCGVTSELFAESEGGAQTVRFVGGTGEIPKRLAALFTDHIVLNAPVLLIEHGTDRVTVHCRGGLVAEGRRVIVAISPTLAGRIMYDPPLPGVRDQLTQRLPNASAMKAFFIYDEPFWRADGLNGQLISDVGPARMSNDTCIPGDDHGVLLLFLEGEQARTFGRLPEEERRAAMTAELVRHFGERAARPEFYIDGEWSDRQWTRGCYNANCGPLVWTTFGHALAEPIGVIHWASTDTAIRWSAYMEGAVEAGERAAHAVIAELAG
ncbi:flavin monoamine oxidase family protein [Mycolicibacterium confluentis]|uniref:Monoamine oxidase n=1 Tax=Mycolicibacterium confluentis TaxID=28047 RepID=A0A7I7Y6V3_9MYCO|nr:flavin monoamine oxidase family protein [Mycolicibacterium confluentis]MCV7319158.1 flavin monoamine oxidase family protein [Mycolicibacterium confluentis]ORV24877.1 monoamine oxidase [Mycolicibacterium confluentis]BBZ36772.1 monoamine oxidase [Mycolicibacterium confluentis]